MRIDIDKLLTLGCHVEILDTQIIIDIDDQIIDTRAVINELPHGQMTATKSSLIESVELDNLRGIISDLNKSLASPDSIFAPEDKDAMLTAVVNSYVRRCVIKCTTA